MQLFLTMTLKTKRKVQCRDFISDWFFLCVCVYVCLGSACRRVCVVRIVCTSIYQRCAVFIGVIHASIIEGNHFKAKLYCDYGDERLLFRRTNTE